MHLSKLHNSIQTTQWNQLQCIIPFLHTYTTSPCQHTCNFNSIPTMKAMLSSNFSLLSWVYYFFFFFNVQFIWHDLIGVCEIFSSVLVVKAWYQFRVLFVLHRLLITWELLIYAILYFSHLLVDLVKTDGVVRMRWSIFIVYCMLFLSIQHIIISQTLIQ